MLRSNRVRGAFLAMAFLAFLKALNVAIPWWLVIAPVALWLLSFIAFFVGSFLIMWFYPPETFNPRPPDPPDHNPNARLGEPAMAAPGK